MRSFGTIIFAIGLLLFMSALGWFDSIDWSIVWPITLMVVGIWMVIRSKSRSCACGPFCQMGGVCGADCEACHGKAGSDREAPAAKSNGSRK